MIINRPPDGWEYKRVTTHPGEMLREEFLIPLKMSATTLATRLHIPRSRVQAILSERRPVTADTALRLARFFNVSVQFWLNMQQIHDLTKAQQLSGKNILREVTPMPRSEAV